MQTVVIKEVKKLLSAGAVQEVKIEEKEGRYGITVVVGGSEMALAGHRNDLRTWVSLDVCVRFIRKQLGVPYTPAVKFANSQIK